MEQNLPRTQAPPTDPGEALAAAIEGEVRVAVARVVARRHLATAGPDLMRAVGEGVAEVLAEYRRVVSSPVLPAPTRMGPGAPEGELNDLRAALWRVGTGAVTDWACSAHVGPGMTVSYTLTVAK